MKAETRKKREQAKGRQRRLAMKNVYISLSIAEAAVYDANNNLLEAKDLFHRAADKDACAVLLGVIVGMQASLAGGKDVKRPG